MDNTEIEKEVQIDEFGQVMMDKPYSDAGPLKVYSEFGEQYLPEKGTDGSAAFDLRTPKDIVLPPGCEMEIDTGLVIDMNSIIHMQFNNPFIMIVPRSSAGIDYGLRMQNSIGIIDRDFRGPRDKIKVFIKRDNLSFQIVDAVSGEISFDNYKGYDSILTKEGYSVKDHAIYDGCDSKSYIYEDKKESLVKYKNIPIKKFIEYNETFLYEKGQRFAQMLVLEANNPYIESIDKDGLQDKSRGGFGSTGDD